MMILNCNSRLVCRRSYFLLIVDNAFSFMFVSIFFFIVVVVGPLFFYNYFMTEEVINTTTTTTTVTECYTDIQASSFFIIIGGETLITR